MLSEKHSTPGQVGFGIPRNSSLSRPPAQLKQNQHANKQKEREKNPV